MGWFLPLGVNWGGGGNIQLASHSPPLSLIIITIIIMKKKARCEEMQILHCSNAKPFTYVTSFSQCWNSDCCGRRKVPQPFIACHHFLNRGCEWIRIPSALCVQFLFITAPHLSVWNHLLSLCPSSYTYIYAIQDALLNSAILISSEKSCFPFDLLHVRFSPKPLPPP